MKQTTRLNYSDANSVIVGRSVIMPIGPIEVTQGSGKRNLPAGSMLAMWTPPAVLQAAKHERGLKLKSGLIAVPGCALAMLYLHAGRHLVAVAADLGHPEVQDYAAGAISIDGLRIALLDEQGEALIVPPLPATLRSVFAKPVVHTQASPMAFALAVNQVVGLLSDAEYLRSLDVDPQRIGTRHLNVHLSGSAPADRPMH